VTHSYEFVTHLYVVRIVAVGRWTCVNIITDFVTHAYEFVAPSHVVEIVAVWCGTLRICDMGFRDSFE